MAAGSTFGNIFQVNTFGESHGVALGCVIQGCPAGVLWDQKLLQSELNRRRPGQKMSVQETIVTQRSEEDSVEVLSGVFEGKTLGTPIAMIVRNRDAKSEEYEQIKNNPRTGHADDVWKGKFGHSDYRGGGRSSGRETVARVMAGAVAQMFLKQAQPSLQVFAMTKSVGPFRLSEDEQKNIEAEPNPRETIDQRTARFPGAQHLEVKSWLEKAQSEGESYGGLARLVVRGLPSGLGQPVFHKLKADLGQALLSIGATSGVSIGEWPINFEKKGTEFHQGEQEVYGGQRGGVSTGENLVLEISFKPTSSVLDTAKKGRHDPFIITRAIPVIEAMTALVLADHLLWQRLDRV